MFAEYIRLSLYLTFVMPLLIVIFLELHTYCILSKNFTKAYMFSNWKKSVYYVKLKDLCPLFSRRNFQERSLYNNIYNICHTTNEYYL